MTSGSHPLPIPVSQESMVPLSQEQQPSHRHGDHLPLNIVSQLGFTDLCPPSKRICLPDGSLTLCLISLQFTWLYLPLCLQDLLLLPILSQHHLLSVDEQLLAIHHIVNTWAAQIDPSSIEGPSGLPADFGPCAFATGMTNNPDILSQSAMLCAFDCNQFVVAQQPEITGLENANVFEYHHMDELKALPFGTRLLNALWSYCRK